MSRRRSLIFLATLATALPLSACAGNALRPANDDGTYCFRVNNKSRHPTCTMEAIPAAAIENQAKMFRPDAGALTLYVVRKRWSDAINVVSVTVDSQRAASTVPNSFVRVTLAPGTHRVSATWDGEVLEQSVAGHRGDIAVVELVGSVMAGRSRYRLERSDLPSSRKRILESRLVADLKLDASIR